MADGEMSAVDSNTSLPEKKSGYTFGHNETLLLISLYQKYEVFFSDVSYKKKAGPGPRISTGVFLCRQSELFLAFRTNHSYSRIVDKKTRPKFPALLPRDHHISTLLVRQAHERVHHNKVEATLA